MIQLTELLLLGFFIGVQHAFDSDHIAAITTLTDNTKNLKTSSQMGAIWGAGHTTTLLLVGLAILLFKITISPALALAFESLVGIMLISLGLSLFLKLKRNKIHLHKHSHDGTTHTHLHSHAHPRSGEVLLGGAKSPSHGHSHLKKPLFIGMLHGLAGSAGLMLLVLATVSTIPQGIAYILLFGLGSIVGMALISTLISLPFLFTKRFSNLHQIIQASAGMVSVVVGASILI
jgi:hypothetical protein